MSFHSKAPLESFDGTTKKISGYVVVNPGRLDDTVTVYVEIDLASLDTGIDMRNRHMRENHLETDRYPVATFSGAAVLAPHGPSLPDGETIALEIAGDLELHGVKRRLRTPVEVTYDPAGNPMLRTVAHFKLKLGDYDIERPRFLLLKLGEELDIKLDVTAVATPGS